MFRNYENKSFSYLSEPHYESIYVADCNFFKVNHSNFELYDSMIFESQLDYCTFSTARIVKNKFGYSSLSNCSICHTNITINNCKGLKNAFFENINFGTIETPVILSDEKALQYLLNYNI